MINWSIELEKAENKLRIGFGDKERKSVQRIVLIQKYISVPRIWRYKPINYLQHKKIYPASAE
jgi:hypothetical protein